MATFAFDRIVSLPEFAEILQKDLGDGFDIEVVERRKISDVKVVQSKWICCVIRVREKGGRTICLGPFGFCPSSAGARIGIILGLLALFIVIGLSTDEIAFPILPASIIGLVIAKVPPRGLVRRVAGILGEAASKV
jgi:hypothetical protein